MERHEIKAIVDKIVETEADGEVAADLRQELFSNGVDTPVIEELVEAAGGTNPERPGAGDTAEDAPAEEVEPVDPDATDEDGDTDTDADAVTGQGEGEGGGNPTPGPFGGILDGTAEEITEAIKGMGVDDLNALVEAEKAGNTRHNVMEVLFSALAVVAEAEAANEPKSGLMGVVAGAAASVAGALSGGDTKAAAGGLGGEQNPPAGEPVAAPEGGTVLGEGEAAPEPGPEGGEPAEMGGAETAAPETSGEG